MVYKSFCGYYFKMVKKLFGVEFNKIQNFRYIFIYANPIKRMNFKLTLWKSIASIVGGIILGYLADGLLIHGSTCELGATCPPNPNYSLIFMVGFILLIYIIWSLVQKK